MQKFRKMYIGIVRKPGSTYTVHEWFSMCGFFSIKTTPLGANKVLLEEMEEGIIPDLINNAKDWIYDKFEDIRGWDPDEADNERVVWIRCHGIPIHAWNENFFASLARNFGEFLGVDEATRKKTTMDVARIRLRSNGYDVFNAVVTANINGSLFHIKMVEEWCGPLQWIETERVAKVVDASSDSDDGSDDGPPLFTAEDGWGNNSDEEWGDEESSEGVMEHMEGRDMGNEEDSAVQETVDVFKEGMHEPYDYMGGIIKPTTIESEDHNAFIGGIIKNNTGEAEGMAAGICSITHISNSSNGGGAQPEVNVEMEDENENCVADGINDKEGCKKKGSPKKTKKKSKKEEWAREAKEYGEERKEKKKKQVQIPAEVNSPCNCNEQNNEVQPETSISKTQSQTAAGVVRNSPNQFNPSASSSSTAKGSDQQVESVGDSGIMMGNNRYEKEMERLQAEKLWHLAKGKLGVTAEDDDELYIEKIREMEERDKVVKGRKGKKQGCK